MGRLLPVRNEVRGSERAFSPHSALIDRGLVAPGKRAASVARVVHCRLSPDRAVLPLSPGCRVGPGLLKMATNPRTGRTPRTEV